MSDDDIVFDEDTGRPLTAEDIAQGMADGFAASGADDFREKMKATEGA